MSIFIDLIWFFKQEWKNYSISIFCLAVIAYLITVPPKIVGTTVDHIQQKSLTSDILFKHIFIMVIVAVLMSLMRYFWRIYLYGTALELSRILRKRLFDHFTLMSPQFYQEKAIGDLMARSTNDVTAVEATADTGVLMIVDTIMTVGVVLFMMMHDLSWQLTLITLIPMPLMAIIVRKYGKELHKRFNKAQAAFSDINNQVQENITGIRVIKSFGQEEATQDSFETLSWDVTKKNLAVGRIDALFDPTILLITGTSFFLAVSIGSYFVTNDKLTIGQLTAFVMYLTQLIWPIEACGFIFNFAERGRVSYNRIMSILATKSQVIEKKNAINHSPSGDITFSIKSFFYPTALSPTLNNISIDIKRGETLGIVGKTGSGKSTILKILLREFDLRDGDITFGGHSIRDISLDSLRTSLAYVPQDPFLFSTTIAENIRFANPNAPIDEIVRVAKIASIHEDVLEFPDQYETIVGERGTTLSGGQKQRISIARALLLDAETLILDDALSAVDANTEQLILSSFREERAGKTTLISSHRLSAIEHANQIIVMENGTIIEKGNHTSLMQLGKRYTQMHRLQQLESFVALGGD